MCSWLDYFRFGQNKPALHISLPLLYNWCKLFYLRGCKCRFKQQRVLQAGRWPAPLRQ